VTASEPQIEVIDLRTHTKAVSLTLWLPPDTGDVTRALIDLTVPAESPVTGKDEALAWLTHAVELMNANPEIGHEVERLDL
jgi:hypothetical protein